MLKGSYKDSRISGALRKAQFMFNPGIDAWPTRQLVGLF